MHRVQVAPGASSVAGEVGRRSALRLALVAGAVAGADQLTKAWAVAVLDQGPIALVGDTVRLALVRNTGSAFNLFTGQATMLALVAVVLVVVIVRIARHEDDPWASWALALLLGGALGNLADRIFRAPGFLEGAVIDFVDLGPWPTFNLADSAITVGAILLVLAGWRERRARA